MEYSPKLKKVMSDIKSILEKNDIGGMIVIHEPGFSEFLLKVDPSYSCGKMENGQFRIKTTGENYSKEEKKQKIIDTCNLINHLATVSSNTSLGLINVDEFLQKKFDSSHYGSSFKSQESLDN